VSVILIFCFAAYSVHYDGSQSGFSGSTIDIIRLIAAALLLIMWLIIKFVINIRINLLKLRPMHERLDLYRKMHIFKLAMLELPAILALIGYYLSGDVLSIAYAGMALFLMVMEFPSKKKVLDTICNDDNERRILENE